LSDRSSFVMALGPGERRRNGPLTARVHVTVTDRYTAMPIGVARTGSEAVVRSRRPQLLWVRRSLDKLLDAVNW
jgi:hypothetical protein